MGIMSGRRARARKKKAVAADKAKSEAAPEQVDNKPKPKSRVKAGK